jgi:hypothetical protein
MKQDELGIDTGDEALPVRREHLLTTEARLQQRYVEIC